LLVGFWLGLACWLASGRACCTAGQIDLFRLLGLRVARLARRVLTGPRRWFLVGLAGWLLAELGRCWLWVAGRRLISALLLPHLLEAGHGKGWRCRRA